MGAYGFLFLGLYEAIHVFKADVYYIHFKVLCCAPFRDVASDLQNLVANVRYVMSRISRVEGLSEHLKHSSQQRILTHLLSILFAGLMPELLALAAVPGKVSSRV